MEHLFFRQVACAAFLLLLGTARCYYLMSAATHPADGNAPRGHWKRHLPAYATSFLWVSYVAWFILAPAEMAKWGSWLPMHWASDVLGWIAVPILGAGVWLFWYSHSTIGRYWSIGIGLKQAHRLVTTGPYRYVRHPLYTALFLGYLGTVVALQSWTLAAWFPVFFASYLVFAREEESVMERGFGHEYRAYRRQTGMLFPKLMIVRADLFRDDQWLREHGIAPLRAREHD